MNSLLTLGIFIAILFLYIHIAQQYKKTDETEIYETDFTSKSHFEEVCELKQPVLFDMKEIVPELYTTLIPQQIARFSNYDINVKDSKDYFKDENVDPIYLPLHTSIKFMESDSEGHLFSENNQDFLEECGFLDKLESIHSILKPPFTIHQSNDLYFGSCNTTLPFKYHTNNRQFLCVTNGKIKIKMASWKNTKYLHPHKDYENYEFRSSVDPKQPQSNYTNDYDKIQFIDFNVHCGHMLYIPPYWWYSITYLDDPTTFAYSVKYSTFVNCVANSWDLLLYSLQQQNITKKIKRTSLPEVQEESEKYENIEETIEDIVADPAIMDPPPIKEVDENHVQEVQDEEKPEPEPPIKQLKMKENIEYSISDI